LLRAVAPNAICSAANPASLDNACQVSSMRVIQGINSLYEVYASSRHVDMKDGLLLERIGLPRSIQQKQAAHVLYHRI
jgi:hypothetical protein